MVGFGLGGIWMGRLSDRFGVATCLAVGTVGLSAGLVAAGLSGGIGWFNLVQGLLIGLFGTSATFAPLVADTSRWFTPRRCLPVGICMFGTYFPRPFWPPPITHFIETDRSRPP